MHRLFNILSRGWMILERGGIFKTILSLTSSLSKSKLWTPAVQIWSSEEIWNLLPLWFLIIQWYYQEPISTWKRENFSLDICQKCFHTGHFINKILDCTSCSSFFVCVNHKGLGRLICTRKSGTYRLRISTRFWLGPLTMPHFSFWPFVLAKSVWCIIA